ncbi:unnamed protein product [Miscanthus lutarioriparius]|uniref:Uncharacterized protein n=1 Tax=Miscanthus lutarioriparius TaxID=422564 RepID=A0A811QRR3_9POAL|nr:unnamed protein product [Miscanthus lutarioriparius]
MDRGISDMKGQHRYRRRTGITFALALPASHSGRRLECDSTYVAMATPADSSPAPHVLVVPCPAQGHMLALLDLTGLSRGLRLTVVATPATAPQLAPLLSAHPDGAVRALTPPFSSHHSVPAGVESAKHLPPALIVAFADLRGPLLSWARARADGPDRVVAVLSDFLCGWTQPLAAELGVPRVVFSPGAVCGTAVLQSLFRRMPRREDERDDDSPIALPDLPGAPVFPWRQMSELYRTGRSGRATTSPRARWRGR